MSDEPLPLKHVEVLGRRMAYVEVGEGAPIVFQHGNPTSSYLWRNIMPELASLGRCIAVDLVGMGGSDKLPDAGPMRYSFAEHQRHLYAAWQALDVTGDAILVLHDWGTALGFEWARQRPERVAGIAYMEGIVRPIASWDGWPEDARGIFQAMRSDAGDQLVLQKNVFVERILPAATLNGVSDAAMAHYRAPFAEPGEGRRPTLDWPRQIPIGGEPMEMVSLVAGYGEFLAQSDVPKLFINAEPGSILTGEQREFCRRWRNQTEVTVPGRHFLQEDSPGEIAAALARFVRAVRG
ncbi:haloalkane dehalogenase [Acuticoccus sp.]|uniref:haloalkane dehalogenase n=1 Tax=Acuticoccus sp. TaxID=1904378 RepID=UPI003B52DF4F